MTALRAQTLDRQRQALLARRDQILQTQQRLLAQASQAQGRLACQVPVRAVLERLQEKSHERAVGAYEKLLTALLQDVLPGYNAVEMDLYSHNGVPALDVYRRKGPGEPREDALHGAGGSVANILSTGLRAIALIRSGKRRFLVLDEADCWIEPQLAPRFASVIQQMAQQLQIQILMISHAEESHFTALPHRLRLERRAQGLSAHWGPDSEVPQWSAEQKGIRSITLEDVQSHQLTHLPMSPDVTLLCGANDIGKSAIVTALRAVFLGEANDTIVRHHQKSARVTIDFGPEHVLRWERFVKGKVRESYRHYSVEDFENPIHATNGAKTLPEWLEPTFGIGLIDGLDAQIGHQKDPIFLLNKPNTLRAKALAIGQDAGHVQEMMALDKKEVAEAKILVKQVEQQLESLSRQAYALAPLAEQEQAWAQTLARSGQLTQIQQQLHVATELRARWSSSRWRQEALNKVVSTSNVVAPPVRPIPALVGLARRWRTAQHQHHNLGAVRQAPAPRAPLAPTSLILAALAQRWQRAAAQQQAGQLPGQMPGAPAPVLPKALVELHRRWSKAKLALQAFTPYLAQARPDVPALTVDQWTGLRDRWRKARAGQSQASKSLSEVALALEEVQRQLATTACPTCGQPWHEASHA